MELHKDKLGLVGLTAIVFGSIIGGAVYNLPQNLASVSAIGPSILSWCITGAGILYLALTFKILADKRPDLNSGIYQYAEEGFGNYIGFNMAWGYWMAAAMGNVALAVLLNDAFGYFFPVLLNHGIETILFGSCFIWIMFFIVSAGIRGASIINTVISILKFLSITLIIGILLTHDKTHLWEGDFWGKSQNIGTIADQIRNSMFITLWAFIGIEGAVIVANRARKKSDVGKASVIGFLCSLVIYLLISTLSYGALPRAEMATLSDPSIGYVLKALVGQWGIVYIACAVIVSLLGGWISWTIIVSEVPSTAARLKIMPRFLAHENKNESPTYALFCSSILMELFMVMVVTASNVYIAAITLTGVMILPTYLFSGLFLLKSIQNKSITFDSRKSAIGNSMIAIMAIVFCIWLLYAAGWQLIMMSSIVYTIGLIVYLIARKENTSRIKDQQLEKARVFTITEFGLALVLVILAVASAILLSTGVFTI